MSETQDLQTTNTVLTIAVIEMSEEIKRLKEANRINKNNLTYQSQVLLEKIAEIKALKMTLNLKEGVISCLLQRGRN